MPDNSACLSVSRSGYPLLQVGAYDEVSALLNAHTGVERSLPPLVRAPLAFDDRHAIP